MTKFFEKNRLLVAVYNIYICIVSNSIKHTNDFAGDRILEEIKIRFTQTEPIREDCKMDSFVYSIGTPKRVIRYNNNIRTISV